MAKKSVGVVELHIEKVILGVAVGFLLVVLFMNLLQNPNTVEYGGESYTPAQIDSKVRDKAQELAQKLQRTKESTGDRLDAPDWVSRLGRVFKEGQIEINELGDSIAAVVPWGLPVERIEVEGVKRRREGVTLVSVEPPSAPKATYMRILGILPEQEETDEEQDEDRTEPLEEDINLVVLESEFDLSRQKELIEKNQYAAEISEVVFALVQVQRQELLGSDWDEWEDIDPVTEYRPPVPPVLKSVGDEGALSGDSLRDFGEYRGKLLGSGVQESILTPKGPTRKPGTLARDPKAKSADRSRPGVSRTRGGSRISAALGKNISGYGSRKVDKPKGAKGKGTKDKDAKDKDAKKLKFSSNEAATKFIGKTLAQAEEAQEAQQFDKAKELAQQVIDAAILNEGTASVQQERQAERILGLAGREKGRDLVGRAASGRYQIVRAFDASGIPGRTYRYRVRLAMVNEYCLASGKLKDSKDAVKPIIQGDWSTPSEPVSIERDTYFYVSGRDRPAGELRIDVFKWYQDGWIKERFDVKPGHEIGGKRDVEVTISGKKYLEEVDFFTGAMVVDMSLETSHEVLQPRKKGYVLASGSQSTLFLAYMDDAGDLQTRYAAEDKADSRYQDLLAQTKKVRVKKVKDKSKDKKSKAKKSKKGSRRGSSRYGSSRSRGRSSGQRGGSRRGGSRSRSRR